MVAGVRLLRGRCELCGITHRSFAEPSREWDEHDRRVEAIRQREERAAQEAARARNVAALLAMGAPRDLLTIAPEPWPAVVGLAAAMARTGARIVVLAGGVGVGKSVAALHWLASSRRRPYFVEATTLAKLPPWVSDWTVADQCVIDDVGSESAGTNSPFQAHLDAIVAHYHGGKRLLITTNLTSAVFRDRYLRNERTRSRFRERALWQSIADNDRRKTLG
jgi:hypothetical protein